MTAAEEHFHIPKIIPLNYKLQVDVMSITAYLALLHSRLTVTLQQPIHFPPQPYKYNTEVVTIDRGATAAAQGSDGFCREVQEGSVYQKPHLAAQNIQYVFHR